MSKQTAVEWLFRQLWETSKDKFTWYSILGQAKAMEKQQIIDACNLQRNDYRGMPTHNKSGEAYYHETYEGNNE